MASFDSHSKTKTLCIENLWCDATAESIFTIFSNFGPIKSVSIKTENVLEKSNRFAYINFENENDATSAMDVNLETGENVLRRYEPDIGKVFISNLSKEVEEKNFHNAFSIFGNILSYKIAKNHLGKSVGCGFLHFETEKAANTCIQKCNGFIFNDYPLNVEKYSLWKEYEVMDEKTKVLLELKMAIRDSLFKSIKVCEVSETEAITSLANDQQSTPNTSSIQSQIEVKESTIESVKKQKEIKTQRKKGVAKRLFGDD